MQTASAGTVCRSQTWGNWNMSCGSSGVVVNPQSVLASSVSTGDYYIAFWVNLDAGATGPLPWCYSPCGTGVKVLAGFGWVGGLSTLPSTTAWVSPWLLARGGST